MTVLNSLQHEINATSWFLGQLVAFMPDSLSLELGSNGMTVFGINSNILRNEISGLYASIPRVT